MRSARVMVAVASQTEERWCRPGIQLLLVGPVLPLIHGEPGSSYERVITQEARPLTRSEPPCPGPYSPGPDRVAAQPGGGRAPARRSRP
jgi:hypothetical protein